MVAAQFRCYIYTLDLPELDLSGVLSKGMSSSLAEHRVEIDDELAGGFSVFAGVGERTREGNDLYKEMIESVSLPPPPPPPPPHVMCADFWMEAWACTSSIICCCYG